MTAQRVALVTGAARGIGAATVAALCAQGTAVVAVDICGPVDGVTYGLGTRDELDEVAARHGEQVTAIAADVRDRAAMARAVDIAVRTYGGLDALVLAAGVVVGGAPVWELDDASFDAVMSVNLFGVHQSVAASMGALMERRAPRTGRIVAVSSAAGLMGMAKLAAYNAAKHGVLGYIKGLAADLAGTGITANALCPGSTVTPILEASAEIYQLRGIDEFGAHQIGGRLIAPEEIAAVLSFLAGEHSSALNGSVVSADGGMTTVR